MDYTFVPPPEKHNGGQWFGHEVTFWLLNDRQEECWTFLTDQFGPKGKHWRIKAKASPDPLSYSDLIRSSFTKSYLETIRFPQKDHAALFKLIWQEDPDGDLNFKEMMNKLFGPMNLVPQSGLSNHHFNYQAIRPSSPPINQISPTSSGILPWYSSGLVSRQMTFRALKSRGLTNPCTEIFLDYDSPVHSKPYWDKERLERKGHKVISTDELHHLLATSDLLRKSEDEK